MQENQRTGYILPLKNDRIQISNLRINDRDSGIA